MGTVLKWNSARDFGQHLTLLQRVGRNRYSQPVVRKELLETMPEFLSFGPKKLRRAHLGLRREYTKQIQALCADSTDSAVPAKHRPWAEFWTSNFRLAGSSVFHKS